LTLDRASPVLLLLNQNLYKWRATSSVCCIDFHREGGIYRGEWDLHRHGEVGLAPGGQATWLADWVERPPLNFSTDSSFSSSCRHVATKAQAEPPQTLAGGALGPLGLGSSPLGPCVKCTLVVMMILTFG
jgi:hypothetical protein